MELETKSTRDVRARGGGLAREHGEVVDCATSWRTAEERQAVPCNPMQRGSTLCCDWAVATGRDGAREAPEASRPGSSRVASTDSLEAARQEKLYHKVMFLYLQLASPEEQIQMCEPIGWRPELPKKRSLEQQLRILQGCLDAKLRPAPPSAAADP
jgi:hypothetical protein